MCFSYKEKGNNLVVCLKEEALKQVCQNRTVRFGKSEYPISAKKIRTSGQCNKGFNVSLNKYMRKNKSTKKQSKNKGSIIKHQTCYIYRDKGHLSKAYPKIQTFIHKIVNNNIPHLGSKNGTSSIKVVSSPNDSHHGIWVSKHLLTNHEEPNKAWVSKLS
jgi:hypothetical protein